MIADYTQRAPQRGARSLGMSLPHAQNTKLDRCGTSAQPNTNPGPDQAEGVSALINNNKSGRDGNPRGSLRARRAYGSPDDGLFTRLATWIADRRREYGARLFKVQDAQARQHGWQITPIQGGLGRRYRDPRFDSLIRCPHCMGTGGTAEERCGPCSGSGRVNMRRPASQEGRRDT